MNEDRNKGPGPPTPGRMPGGFMMISIAIGIVIILNLILSSIVGNQIQRIEYSEFLEHLEAGRVQSVEVQPDRLLITLAPEVTAPEDESIAEDEPEQAAETGATGSFLDRLNPANAFDRLQTNAIVASEPRPTIVDTGRMPDPDLLSRLSEHGVAFSHIVPTTNWLSIIFFNFMLPLLLLIIVFTFISRRMAGMMGGGRGGIMGIGQSNAKVYMEKKTGITFDDVAGQEEAKESLTEIVDFLHNPDKYAKIGALQPKGALLVGPPGTGKTLLAKAVAGEANVVFFSLSGSDFVEMFVGVGASRVRDLFKQASQQAPAIIFIDEIDAIGKSRDNQMSSNDERENTLNQLLSEMDGFDTSKGIVILGATNRPEILDKALLRPGRFDRRINVELPDLRGREDILKVHAKKVTMAPAIDLRRIAMITPGAAGADLANMINEAALNAVRMGRDEVIQSDLTEAVEVVIAGKEKKDRIMTEKEKRIVAFHEVGHALARVLQKDAMPVEKISIVPRTKGALGYVLSAPEEEKFMQSKDEMIAEIVTLMSGRAAEEVSFNVQTTGASNDIEKATRMARSMVSMYGMSEKFGMMSLENIQNRYLDGRPVLQVSDKTGAELDVEVSKILQNCYQKAIELLKQNEEKLKSIANALFDKETMTGDEFMALYRKEEPLYVTDSESAVMS